MSASARGISSGGTVILVSDFVTRIIIKNSNSILLFLGEPRLLCGNDSIVVTFNRGLIEDQGLIDDWRYIHFQGYETSSCFAHTSADGQMYILSIPSPIDRSCGSFMLVRHFKLTKLIHLRNCSSVKMKSFDILDFLQ